jgi:hypothetical protein
LASAPAAASGLILHCHKEGEQYTREVEQRRRALTATNIAAYIRLLKQRDKPTKPVCQNDT